MTTPPPPPENYSYSDNGGLVYPQSDDDKTMGMLAHGGSILIGFWAPLLVLLLKKESAFAVQEAKESLNFQICITIAAFISGLLIFIVIGCVLLPIVLVGALVFEVIATVKVNNGEPYRYPVNIRLIK